MATMDPDETFLVLDGHRLTGSARAELPPEHGTASERESEEILPRGGGKWYATNLDGKLSDPFDE